MVDTPNPVVLAADVVLLCRQSDQWQVLLIQRGWPPYQGCWALPGGHVDPGETFQQAARRELMEETGVTAPAGLYEVGVYDAPDRDPRGRVISVAFVGVLTDRSPAVAGDDATAARWVPAADVLTDPCSIAFDHDTILRAAISRVEHRRENTELAEQVWALSISNGALHLALNRAREAHANRLARALIDLDTVSRESDLREQEIITLTVERDRLETRLSELDTPGGEVGR